MKNPKEYDIRENEVTFGTFPTDNKNLLAAVENLEEVLKTFDYNKLSVENSLTYDILKCYLNMTERDAEYILYDEPMGLVSGVQTQLPVILSEYPFYEQSDVDTYLQLMKTTPEYFASLLKFEQKKSKAGLFMSDKMAEQVIEQCKAFRDMGENNYLYSTFAERVWTVTSLSDKQKSDYIQKNARMMKAYVLPAYDNLICTIEKLKGSGKNEQGLCYLPKGKDYYEQVVEASTGSTRSVEEIRDMTRKSLRSNYGMVLQDTWLKAGTIRENIAMGKPEATEEEIIAAAKQAHAHSFIMRLPQGYDTVIGESGGSLSQGQKQLLCIARVMLCLPPMLFLDEATSSIDTRTEIKIQKAFDTMMRGRTSFIVAHRLSTIREADKILVMRDGHIVEQGKHEELLAKNGFYARLYQSQFAH